MLIVGIINHFLFPQDSGLQIVLKSDDTELEGLQIYFMPKFVGRKVSLL